VRATGLAGKGPVVMDHKRLLYSEVLALAQAAG
jgi:hypothetical protein